ncbi:MAG: E3 ubiquitin-protein ligase rad18 [Phylliscum demangeonii]|nr:MAG: E3 ubiquitin-protein ligase rad18 [Phylliscum demangeonii]
MAATTQPDDISDPTEWSQTALASLSSVDAALRCQVCKDFYTTPMMTSCAHTFCSLCIRRCLANDGKCPMCRASEQEVKLRRNCALDEVVAAFRAARQKTLLFAVESAAAAAAASAATATDKDDRRASKKRKADTMSAEEEMSASAPSSQQGRKTRSQSRREAGLSTEKPLMASSRVPSAVEG